MPEYRVLPAGDTALVVEFGEHIDRQLSAWVLALARRLNEARLDGIVETVPTFRSLMVHYDPLVLSDGRAHRAHRRTDARPAKLRASPAAIGACRPATTRSVAPDLDDVAARTGLSPAQVIERHSAVTYHVYMLGFLPGWPIWATCRPSLRCRAGRRRGCRCRPARSAIATTMSCIFPFETPCGWHLIGRSPVPLWQRRPTPGALLAPGDKVTLRAGVACANTRTCSARAADGALDDRAERRRHGSGGMKPALRVLAAGPADHGPGSGTARPSAARHSGQRRARSGEPARRQCAGRQRARCRRARSRLCGPDARGRCRRRAACRSSAPRRRSRFFRMKPRPAARASARCAAFGCGAARWCASARSRAAPCSTSRSRAASTSQPVLGSVSTYIRGGFGGWQGRALVAGDLPAARARQRRATATSASSTGSISACRRAFASSPDRRTIISPTSRSQHFFDAEYTRRRRLRPHGHAARRSAARSPARLRHHLRRHRAGLDPGAGQRPADRAAGGPPDDRRLSEDRDRHLGRPCRRSAACRSAQRSRSSRSRVEGRAGAAPQARSPRSTGIGEPDRAGAARAGADVGRTAARLQSDQRRRRCRHWAM